MLLHVTAGKLTCADNHGWIYWGGGGVSWGYPIYGGGLVGVTPIWEYLYNIKPDY